MNTPRSTEVITKKRQTFINPNDPVAKIKGKLDFDIELIDDFQVDTEELDIPGITYDKPEDIDALDAKLRELDFVKSIKAERANTNNANGNNLDKPKAVKPERREYDVFGKAEAMAEEKRKAEEAERRRLAELDREALRDIGADAQLSPEEYKKQFPEVAEQLKNIFTEPEVQQQTPGTQDLQQQQLQPNFPTRNFGQQIPTPGFLQQKPFNFGMMGPQQQGQPGLPGQPVQQGQYMTPIVDPDEAYCRTLSANPEACKIDPKCFYSANIQNPERRCHKDVKGIPK